MAESKMPARIWALPGITRGYWSPAPSKHPNSAKTAFIRADLVEPLVEALRRIADPRNIHFAGDAQVVAARALSSYEAAQ